MVDIFSRIEQRWNFALPEQFRVLSRVGAIDYESPRHINLTNIKWYHPAKVEGQDIPDYWVPGLVPFAGSPKGDSVCWVLDWKSKFGIGTAFCLRGSNSGTGYAPDFAGAVYRSLLEELSGSFLVNTPEEFLDVFRRYIDCVSVIFREGWVNTLTDLMRRPTTVDDDGLRVINVEEVRDIVHRDLVFPQLDVRFKYTR
jgi:hypothetical protein